MSNTVIVALPSVDDRVNKISSEKVPHLTLISLGNQQLDEDQILYIQHTASELSPFYLTVDYRDKLGENDADVLFFEDNPWDLKRVREFRHYLLLSDPIKKMYDSSEQFPEWVPHLTLGYPETPAHEDDSDYPGIRSVAFDRIAVWTGDYEGPEFRLKYDDTAMEVAMSDMTTAERGAAAVSALRHYGVPGMRWGVRKDDKTSRGGSEKGPTSTVVTQKKPGTFAKSEGGERHELHPDSAKSLHARQKAKKSTTDALSNEELKSAVERMRLEQQFNQLEFSSDRRSRGQRFLAGFFGKKKPTKYRDVHEGQGEQTADAVKKAMAARAAMKAAKVAATAAAVA